MNKSRNRLWFIFGACSLLVAGMLVGVTIVVLNLEKRGNESAAKAAHQEAMLIALYRMDYWLNPRLTREDARPYYEYSAFYPQEDAFSKYLQPLVAGEVRVASPLLTYESEIFRLHFQIRPEAPPTSACCPSSNELDLVQQGIFAEDDEQNAAFLARMDANRAILDDLSRSITFERLDELLRAAEKRLDAPLPDASERLVVYSGAGNKAYGVNNPKEEWQHRKTQRAEQQDIQQMVEPVLKLSFEPSDVDARPRVERGPFLPVWLNEHGDDESCRLLFVRRIKLGQDEIIQGIMADWPRLREILLGQVSDLFASATLKPMSPDEAINNGSGQLMSTIPALLVAETPPASEATMFTPARITLGMTWIAAIVTLFAVGNTLRTSIAYGEKRSRFASAVTHELRTPLTTFQMYSEMLAEGMVKDDEQRRVYLQTLKDESHRLSTLVENVLAYARLEDGRIDPKPDRVTMEQLVDRVAATLQQRANREGATLTIHQESAPEDTAIVDVEVIGQILFNLVDNACKYACNGSGSVIDLTVERSGQRLRFIVQDHGPGIDRAHQQSIFSAFDRGERHGGDAVAGVGLGLALCRGLARDMGGDLRLEESPDGAGARFVLSVPVTS